MIKALDKALAIAVRDCLAVTKNETVLVVTDEMKKEIGEALYLVSKRFAKESLLMLMPQRANHGQEPPPAVARAMLEADAVFLVTRMSLSHTEARRKANARGARIASMPGITEDMILRTLNADYKRIKRLGEKLAKIVSGARRIRITTRLGTDLSFSAKGRKAQPDTGVLPFKCGFTNLPAGEVYLAPLEGTAEGKLVIDGAIAGMWPLKRPIEVAISKGYAVGVGPGDEAARLWRMLCAHGRQALNVAEFGIGTNYKARLTGNVLEDEKVRGTIHIAFGDNSSMGGAVRVPSHQDGIVTKPTVWIGDRKIMEQGRLLIS